MEMITGHNAEIHGRTLIGYASVFYDANNPGTKYSPQPHDFIEIVNRRAFDKTMKRKRGDSDVISTMYHCNDSLLGRTGNGSLRVWTDSVGLAFEVELPDTSVGNDLPNLCAPDGFTAVLLHSVTLSAIGP